MKKLILITFVLLGSFAAVLWGSPPAATESTGSYSPSPIFSDVRATANVTVDGQFVGNGAGITNGGGYTVLLVSSANTTPATSTTYFFGGCPGLAGNLVYGTASVDIPRAGTLKRVFYKIRCGTVDTTEADGVAHSIRLNNTTDVASQTFAYTQAATNVINSTVSQAVAKGDTVVVKVVTPASWSVSPAGFHVYVTLYIE